MSNQAFDGGSDYARLGVIQGQDMVWAEVHSKRSRRKCCLLAVPVTLVLAAIIAVVCVMILTEPKHRDGNPMSTLGQTGHRKITQVDGTIGPLTPDQEEWISNAILFLLDAWLLDETIVPEGFTGRTGMAEGADVLFAEAIFACNHQLEVGLACVDFAEDFNANTSLYIRNDEYFTPEIWPYGGPNCSLEDQPSERFEHLMTFAHDTLIMNNPDTGTAFVECYNDEYEAAPYVAVGEYVLDGVSALLAVWDEQESKGQGGTGDVVENARDMSLPVVIVNPLTKTVTYERWSTDWGRHHPS